MAMVEKKKKPLLLVGIFFWETMSGEFFARCLQIINRLFQLSQLKDGAIAFKVSICAHKSKVQAKTELAEEAIRTGAKWVMFLDSKLNVEADVVEEMIAVDKDIVNIRYSFVDHGKALRPTFFNSGEMMSCGLVKTDVFRHIDEPYFLNEEDSDSWVSEDIFFINQVKKKEYKITNMEYCFPLAMPNNVVSQILIQKAGQIKVLIAVPVAETVSSQFVNQFLGIIHCLLNRCLTEQGFSFGVATVYGEEIMIARTKMVEEAVRINAKKILWIDSDSMVTQEQVTKILDKEEDVVSGITVQKSAPFLPVVLKNEDGFLNMQVDVKMGQGLIEVDAVGMGLTMTKTKVFDKIERPYFKVTRHELPDGSVEYEGEDVYMSRKLAAAGVKLYVDTDISYGHIGKVATIQDYDAFSRERLIYLKECRENALAVMIKYCHGEYTSHQLKAELMKARKDIKDIDEEQLNGKSWLFERADWHLWGEQWERDQSLVAQVINMCYKYGGLKILCLDRGIGQLPSMLLRAGSDVDCLELPESFIPAGGRDEVQGFWKNRKLNIVPLNQLTKNYYDVILIVDWFEHLDDEDFDEHIKVLREIVKPNSELIVSCAPHNDRHRHYQWTVDRKEAVMALKRSGQ